MATEGGYVTKQPFAVRRLMRLMVSSAQATPLLCCRWSARTIISFIKIAASSWSGNRRCHTIGLQVCVCTYSWPLRWCSLQCVLMNMIHIAQLMTHQYKFTQMMKIMSQLS